MLAMGSSGVRSGLKGRLFGGHLASKWCKPPAQNSVDHYTGCEWTLWQEYVGHAIQKSPDVSCISAWVEYRGKLRITIWRFKCLALSPEHPDGTPHR